MVYNNNDVNISPIFGSNITLIIIYHFNNFFFFFVKIYHFNNYEIYCVVVLLIS